MKFILCVFSLALVVVTKSAGAPSDATRNQLGAWAANIKGATARHYALHDNTGLGMDTIKVIPDPNGGYIALYHTNVSGTGFVVSLATSPDLGKWTYKCRIGTYAADPDIYACSNGAFVVVWEQTTSAGSQNHIHFAYYPTRATLFLGTPSKSYDAPMTLSNAAEGTPNIYSVTLTNGDINTSTIDIGGHYNNNTSHLDRQQRGTLTNFSSWSTAKRSDYDNAILYWKINGNIGQRDLMTYNGYNFNIIEGQGTANDFSTFKIYIYDFQTLNADPLSLTTDGGSKSCGNPHWTYLIGPDGKPCIVFSVFIFSELSAPGEAGPALYYVTLPAAPAISNGPATTTATVGSSYNFTYTYTGYPVPTFSVASGALPPGLTLSTSGELSGTPTAAGVYTGTIQSVNSQGTATQNFTITIPTPYSIWQGTNFTAAEILTGLTTMATDFDNDGMPNLLKYAFGMDPKAFNMSPVTVTILGNNLQISFPCNSACTDITYTVQSSSTLAPNSWTDIAQSSGGATMLPIGTLSTVTDTGIRQRTVTVTDSTPLPAKGKRFFRVKVTNP